MMRKPERAWVLCAAICILWMVSGWTQTNLLAREQAAEPTGDTLGVLVMAHGGGADWNKQVDASIAGLRDRLPVSLAFGMANPQTLQASLDSLRDHGASTVAVVRLFISGDAFLHQTEFLFGLRSDPPEQAIMGHHLMDGANLKPLKTNSRILLDRQGMVGSSEAARILLARANESASSPEKTGVMIIAHGMGSEEYNNRLLDAMRDAAEALRSEDYGEVHVAALREDWAEPRAEAERQIRATVAEMGGTPGPCRSDPLSYIRIRSVRGCAQWTGLCAYRRTAAAPSGHGMDRLPRHGQFLLGWSGVAARIMRNAITGPGFGPGAVGQCSGKRPL